MIAPFVLDLNDYKVYVTDLVKEKTGRQLAIDGRIDLSLLPIPTIKIDRVRFANLKGAATPVMVKIATIEASIALAPLFKGRVEIDSLTFVDPVIELETLADGRANWDIPLAGNDSVDGEATALSIDSLNIVNATLIYRDSAANTVERIEKLHMEAAIDSISGPFRATGRLLAQSGDVEAVALEFEINIDRLDRRPLPLQAVIKLTAADASISFNGTATSASIDAELTGKLKLESPSLARIITVLTGRAGNSLLDQPLSATATVTALSAAAGINDIRFDFGGIQGSGAISATLAQGPQIDVAIALNRVDLDALMAKAGEPGEDTGAAATVFELPDGVYATLDLRIDALVYNQGIIRQAQLIATLDQRTVTLQQASALLPGGSDITLFGVLDALDGKPHFTGQIEASADNLRAALDWLDVAYPDVPQDRLRKLSLSTKIDVTPDLAKISAIDLQIDLTRLNGGVNVGLGARPAFNAIITIDQINLDAYLPVASDGNTRNDAEQGNNNPFALLDIFDAEIKAKIGSLVYQSTPVSGLAIDAGIRSGILTLRSLTVSDFAGSSGTISGTVDAAKTSFDMAYDLDISDAARLYRLAGIAPPSITIGTVTAAGRVSGDLSTIALESRVTLWDSEATFRGAVTDLSGTPSINAEISVHSDNLNRLARRFGTTLPAKAEGPFSLKGNVKGDMASADINFNLSAMGAEISLVGSLNDLLGAAQYDLALSAEHPDLVTLVESLADGVRFENRDLGKISLQAKIIGDPGKATIDEIDALIGPSQINGAASLRFDGPRPFIEADLIANEFIADMFLAVVAKGGGGVGRGGSTTPAANQGNTPAERWSRKPIDLSGLYGFDLDAKIASKALVFGKYRFEDVALSVKIEDGVLEVDKLSGRLYGAPTTISARLAATTPPTLDISFALQGADLQALMIDTAQIDAVSGLVELTGKFNSRGRSEFELISALEGDATLAVRDGVINGISLGQLNDRLANINNEADMIALVGNALNGGTTAIVSLNGSFTASKGVLRSDDLRAVLDGGEGRASASIDLPHWQLAMNSEFRLTGHPDAPPVGLLLMGPIDNPEREIRDQALRDFVLAKIIAVGVRKLIPALTGDKAVGGVLGGVLDALAGDGGAKTEPATAPAEETPPPKPDPSKLFQNLLQGLIQGVGN